MTFKIGHPNLVSSEARKRAGISISLAKKGVPLSEVNRIALQNYWESKKGKSTHPPYGKIIICPICGIEKYKYPRDLKRTKTSFCSAICAYQSFKGKNHSPKSQFKKGQNSGSLHPQWKGGITPVNNTIRGSLEYKLWQDSVKNRDGNCCTKCGDTRISRLMAHHILNFSSNPELRFAIDNGITFCRPCHKAFHKKYTVRNNSRAQINEFLAMTYKKFL